MVEVSESKHYGAQACEKKNLKTLHFLERFDFFKNHLLVVRSQTLLCSKAQNYVAGSCLMQKDISFFHLQPVALCQGETADFQAWLLTVSGSKNLF